MNLNLISFRYGNNGYSYLLSYFVVILEGFVVEKCLTDSESKKKCKCTLSVSITGSMNGKKLILYKTILI